jgi:hypothetical protein
MAVSANTLFHFTDKEKLRGILRSQFFPKYSLEDLSYATPETSIYASSYIPMVCFCDLLFSQIKDHIDFYGDYGIGLRKKEWGLKRGISPIVYVPYNSISARHIQSIAAEIGRQYAKSAKKGKIREELPNFYKYIKAYQGETFNRRAKTLVSKVFYDEREWRFVPKKFNVIPEAEVRDNIIQVQNADMQNTATLPFKAADVKYIIVKTEREIPEFVNFIEKDLSIRFPDVRDRQLLLSKLISVEQIRDDI